MAQIIVKIGDRVTIYRAGGKDSSWISSMSNLIGTTKTVAFFDADDIRTKEDGYYIPLSCLKHVRS